MLPVSDFQTHKGLGNWFCLGPTPAGLPATETVGKLKSSRNFMYMKNSLELWRTEQETELLTSSKTHVLSNKLLYGARVLRI